MTSLEGCDVDTGPEHTGDGRILAARRCTGRVSTDEERTRRLLGARRGLLDVRMRAINGSGEPSP
jgi:hypothetical protein